MKKSVITISILLYSFSTYACSLAPPTQQFNIDSKLEKIPAIQPSFKVSNLSRGKKAQHSCSGLASLSLKLEKPTTLDQGYTFEKTKGNFDKIYFNDKPVTLTKYTSEMGEYVFYYNETTNDPIDITLKITAVSKSGHTSKPQVLHIKHLGNNEIDFSILEPI